MRVYVGVGGGQHNNSIHGAGRNCRGGERRHRVLATLSPPPTWVLESLRSERAIFCICWLGVLMKGEEGLDSGRERLLCPGDLRSPRPTVTDP